MHHERGPPVNRRTRFAVTGLAALVLASGGVWLWAQPSAASQLVTGAVTSGDLTQTVSATGTVSDEGTASVSFPTAATVTAVQVAVGDQVTAGQVLATLDTTALQSALDEADLTLAEAKESLTQAQDSSTTTASTGSSR